MKNYRKKFEMILFFPRFLCSFFIFFICQGIFIDVYFSNFDLKAFHRGGPNVL